MNKIPIVSLFTGGGFLDMGFEMAGFDIVWSNEYDKIFAELHSFGMTEWRTKNGNQNKAEIFNSNSISELRPEQIIEEVFPIGKPLIWGIIGGPPCQDFSLNGNLNGFSGERGKMTIIFFDWIQKLKPSFFVMENVPGLMHHKDNRKILNAIVEKHCKRDYHMDWFILNALDYGVPQNRERVFIIGIKKNDFNPPLKETIYYNLFQLKLKLPIPKYKNARIKFHWPGPNPYGETPTKPNGIPDELFVNKCLATQEDIKNKVSNLFEYFPLVKDPDKRKLIHEGETKRQSFKRLHRYRYSPTACYGNNEVHLHPYKNRRLSVRESLRIQGVPDSYVLPQEISLSKKFKMIGNGVPVPLAFEVAKSLRKFIEDYKVHL
jgi:DNA (cytosine-5)-methyltransferase 1